MTFAVTGVTARIYYAYDHDLQAGRPLSLSPVRKRGGADVPEERSSFKACSTVGARRSSRACQGCRALQAASARAQGVVVSI